MDPKLQRLLDEAEIRDVHLRYCRGIDRMDFDLVRSLLSSRRHRPAWRLAWRLEGDVEGSSNRPLDYCRCLNPPCTLLAISTSRYTGTWPMPNIMHALFTGQDRMATNPRPTMSSRPLHRQDGAAKRGMAYRSTAYSPLKRNERIRPSGRRSRPKFGYRSYPEQGRPVYKYGLV